MDNIFLVEESTLQNIADAIRSKKSDTDITKNDKIKVKKMSEEIYKLASLPTITLSGDCTDLCHNYPTPSDIDQLLNQLSYCIETENITNAKQMFYYASCPTIPFDINLSAECVDMTEMFTRSSIRSCPIIKGGNITSCSYLFFKCSSLKEIPEESFKEVTLDSNLRSSKTFYGCSKLKYIPSSIMHEFLGNAFGDCYCLDAVENMPISSTARISDEFTSNTVLDGGGMFDHCYRLRKLTFKKDNKGNPIIANWANQIIDLTNGVGYVSGQGPKGEDGQHHQELFFKDTDVDMNKCISNRATYDLWKDDPDAFSISSAYSRYTYESALETLDSLPDTSGYIMSLNTTISEWPEDPSTLEGINYIIFSNNASLDQGVLYGIVSRLKNETEGKEAVLKAKAKGWLVKDAGGNIL